ncbi:thermonuclease family protein [Roseobacter sp. S98]|uniref:thermonuclease family protein n=1 Tax=Roseobacter algicola (ex Choi et al. 2025) (nom. illeg.) TaxID=3092138 RepID=UPI003F514ADC
MVFLMLATVLAVAVSSAFALAGVTGEVRVIDGDTLDVGDTRVRLHGIDAPEQDQTCKTEQGQRWNCGAWVSDTVRDRYAGEMADCEETDRDRYGRVVAVCFVDGTDIGEALVRDGLAFAFRRYSMDYDLAEKSAAVRDAGLHASRVQSPSQFRETRAVGRIPPDRKCRIKGNISASGVRIFHVPGQQHYERTGIRAERGERWFCSADDAIRAGWRAARR